MSTRPFMQLYVSDFVGDTLSLSAQQIGAYMLLLMAMWNAHGSLPDDAETLSRIARVKEDEWPRVWEKLAGFFDAVDGKIQQERLTFELDKFARKSAARKMAGSIGGKAKALKSKNSGLAIATANAVASSRNHIKKAGASLDDPTEGTVRLDRNANAPLFDACLRITQDTVPGYMTGKSFPVSVVAQAQQLLDAETSTTH